MAEISGADATSAPECSRKRGQKMNSYKVTIKHYSGKYIFYYIKAENENAAWDEAHNFITPYDGVREIVAERIKASDVREYTDVELVKRDAWNRKADGFKAEQMDEAIKRVLEIAKITRPECDTRIVYLRVTKENLEAFTEWDCQRFGIHVGDERILVGKAGEEILYALNVSGDSVMQSIAELTNLLAGKGW